MLEQRKSPIVIMYSSSTTIADAETAVNDALTDNAGYCLVDNVRPSGAESASYFVLDDDWGVANPIHSVVLVEITESIAAQLPSALSDNPGYRFVGGLEVPSAGYLTAILLGKS